jgi:hypothetical protein
MAMEFRALFPNADHYRLRVTNPKDPHDNCIAWALGNAERFWWPSRGCFWPKGVPREVTIEAFSAAFALHGWKPCEDIDLEREEGVWPHEKKLTSMSPPSASRMYIAKTNGLKNAMKASETAAIASATAGT